MSALAGYRDLVRLPEVRRLAVAFLCLGCANTMQPVALVLFARGATHSFAAASLVFAAVTAGAMVSNPFRGRLVDRVGPRRAVLLCAGPSVLTDAGLIVAGAGHAPVAVLVVLALLAGGVGTPALAALRSAFSALLREAPARHAGFALMTMLQETTFISGPILAGGLVGAASPVAAVAGAASLDAAGALLLATAPAAGRHVTHLRGRGRLPALGGPGIRTLLGVNAAFGLSFGLLDVAFPAFARSHGSAALAGILLSALAVGIWLGGLIYGTRHTDTPATRLYPRFCLLAAAGFAPLILTPSLGLMVVLAGLAGLCIAPATTSFLAVIDVVAPAAHRNEAITWLSTLYASGSAVGAAVAGQLIASGGVRAPIIAACASAAVGGIFATARSRSLARSADHQPGRASA